jgi:hypothetical protein
LSAKRKRKKSIVIPGAGDACPRCGQLMQIRQYDVLDEEQLQQSSYTRWFCCMNEG